MCHCLGPMFLLPSGAQLRWPFFQEALGVHPDEARLPLSESTLSSPLECPLDCVDSCLLSVSWSVCGASKGSTAPAPGRSWSACPRQGAGLALKVTLSLLSSHPTPWADTSAVLLLSRHQRVTFPKARSSDSSSAPLVSTATFSATGFGGGWRVE